MHLDPFATDTPVNLIPNALSKSPNLKRRLPPRSIARIAFAESVPDWGINRSSVTDTSVVFAESSHQGTSPLIVKIFVDGASFAEDPPRNAFTTTFVV
jgi:hypothetical protein